MHLMSKEDMKETAWRWRCKVFNTTDEKTLSDYTDSIVEERGSAAAGVGGAGVGGDISSRGGSKAAKDAASGLGSALTVKTLYEGPNVGDNFHNWQDYPPRQLSKSASKVQDRVAIKLYKVRDKSKPVIGGRFVMKLHQMDVQNPLLVAALAPILRASQDLHIDPEETAVFSAPFRPLYFCYDAFAARLRSLRPHVSAEDAALQPYLKLFVFTLDDIFAEVRAKRRQLADRGLMSFEHAWTYFPRYAVVRSHGHNSEVLSRVLDTAYAKPTLGPEELVVRAEVLRFNGEAFVWERQELKIPIFAGNRPIVEFDHCPLTHLPSDEQEDLKERLAARGRLVLDCQALTYRRYTGVGIHRNEQGKTEKHNVDGRVLVDVVGYNKHHLAQGVREGKDAQSVKNIVDGTGRMTGRDAGRGRRRQQQRAMREIGGGAYGDDADGAGKDKADESASGKIRRLTEEEQERNRAAMLRRPEELMFMSPLVEGYALKNKLWFSFYVEDLRPIQWNDQAYDHLVYDEQQKDLVLSFVESHGHTTSKVEDVIIGKGEGLIILLSGPPGTGKTLTAEAVADRTHRPLFYLQAEDLGINAAALGANVKKVFEMASEWDAVILLDEADVFMAERHPQDIARNELVSIFLRELEYFRGIIFLTTNLYDTIDSAFRSRVSLHLLFRPLSAEARLSVWRKFLARVEGGAPGAGAAKIQAAVASGSSSDRVVDVTDEDEKAGDAAGKADVNADVDTDIVASSPITEEDLTELSAWNLNGREIKTAVKMVTSWCAHKGHEMTLERLENGIRVTSPHASKTTQAGGSDDLYD